ncbi:expansin-like protein [Heterostelium album PN500]|uniref:Expansin-like protein n=1 Tax=Heterostelium pallidum (strain ATCC 26659 / Pp 5 / PN500) TaxID=670386 RepID=D3B7L5_HETP5|nr:expansin-like protein [Heterostelium album PN500]EFA82758.1 expansin-like protein [Heterostelium album PN500]|eukprot:XP_020434875.1 expansin-like protein [Heterostelium album PN500]
MIFYNKDQLHIDIAASWMSNGILFLTFEILIWQIWSIEPNTLGLIHGSVDLGECFPSRSTWYEAIEHGNCGYGPLLGPTGPGNQFIAAAATVLYNGSYIVDQCPDPGWCDTSFPHLDLSPMSFDKVGGPDLGVVMTSAKKVSCDYVVGNIKLFMKDAATSTQWFEFMIFNHRTGLDHVIIQTADGIEINLPRTTYNYWSYNGDKGQVKFPIVAQVYDQYGSRVDVYVQAFTGAVTSLGQGQFPEPVTSFANDTCQSPFPVDSNGNVYQNGLVTPLNVKNPNLGWADWSYSATINWCEKTTSGATANSSCVVSATISPGGAIQIGTMLPVKWEGIFTGLEFYVRANQPFTGLAVGYGSSLVATPVTSSWTKFTYTMAQIGAPADIGKPAHLDFRNPTNSPFSLQIDGIKFTTN